MERTASANIVMHSKGSAQLILSLAVANKAHVSEELAVFLNEEPVAYQEIEDQHGTRLHIVDVGPGRVHISYEAVIQGHAELESTEDIDRYRYLRQSRYCESDELHAIAAQEFRGLTSRELVQAVRNWVHDQLIYLPGWSRPTDGAVHTLISKQGVCRDFAHLAIALLRARDVPARLVSTYAPGLTPMDFHAVAEAYVDGTWEVIDPTGRAPRQTMMRIATGRDAADIAWLTSIGDEVTFGSLAVSATADELPADDHAKLVTLGK